jgi:hypothetical protein
MAITHFEVDFDFEYSDFQIHEEEDFKYTRGIKTNNIEEAIHNLEATLKQLKKEVEQ